MQSLQILKNFQKIQYFSKFAIANFQYTCTDVQNVKFKGERMLA